MPLDMDRQIRPLHLLDTGRPDQSMFSTSAVALSFHFIPKIFVYSRVKRSTISDWFCVI